MIVATDEGNNLLRITVQGDREELPNPYGNQAPVALPGTPSMLLSGTVDDIRAGDIAGGEFKSLGIIGSDARFVAGFIFYSQGSNLFAARFDPVTRELKSSPVLVLSGVRSEVYGFSQWSVSENGTFLYAPGIAANENPLQWARADEREELKIPVRGKGSFEISPAGDQLAVLEPTRNSSRTYGESSLSVTSPVSRST